MSRLYLGRFSDVHIGGPSSNQATSLESQMIHPTQLLPGRTLRELNQDNNWRKLLGKDNQDRHQRDIELILRLFSLFEEWNSYEKPMKEYLNNSMRLNVGFASARAKRFERFFPIACKTVVESLGEKPFHIRGPLNSSVLDATMIAILENKGNASADLADRYRRLISHKAFEERTRTSTTDTITVRDRIRDAKKYLT